MSIGRAPSAAFELAGKSARSTIHPDRASCLAGKMPYMEYCEDVRGTEEAPRGKIEIKITITVTPSKKKSPTPKNHKAQSNSPKTSIIIHNK